MPNSYELTQPTLFKLRQVTPSEMQRLAEAYAIKYNAITQRVSKSDINRLCDRFDRVFDALIAKYPELSLEHNRPFLKKMNELADSWWASRPMRGAGVDW